MNNLTHSILMAVSVAVIYRIYLNSFLQPLESYAKSIIGWSIFLIWEFIKPFLNLYDMNNLYLMAAKFILNIICLEAVGFLAYKGNRWEKSLFSIFFILYRTLIESSSLYITTFSQFAFSHTFLSELIILINVLLINFIVTKRIIFIESKSEKVLNIIRLISIFLYSIFFALEYHWKIMKSNDLISFILVNFVFILIIIYIHISYIRVANEIQERKNNNILINQIDHLYQSKTQSNQYLKQIQHDTQRTLNYLHNTLKDGESEKALEAVDSLLNDIKSVKIIQTGHLAIDSAINHNAEYCAQNNIIIDPEISISKNEKITISDVDLCLLIGNAFNNATEAIVSLSNSNLTKRIVSLKLFADSGSLIFSVSNPCNPERLKWSKNKKELRTTKTDSETHGLGLCSIQNIAKKYNGSMTISENNGIFTLSAVLYY